MDVLIHITGTQKMEDQEPDTIDMTTSGTLEKTDTGWVLAYLDTWSLSGSGNYTTLHISDRRVLLERTGTLNSVLVFEYKRRHHSNYATPYGNLDLGTYATEMHQDLTPEGGTLDFCYTLGFNGGVNSAHRVHITVQKEKTSCPIV